MYEAIFASRLPTLRTASTTCQAHEGGLRQQGFRSPSTLPGIYIYTCKIDMCTYLCIHIHLIHRHVSV